MALVPQKDEKDTPPQREEPSDPLPPINFDNSRRTKIDEDMDMTPMVDVTFLLLIFFMVTAAFSLQRSFEVPAPDNNQPSQNTVDEIQNNDDYIIVRIDAYNTFWVVGEDTEHEAASKQELLVRLREAKRGGSTGVKPTRLLVIAHGDALHEKVVTALDAGTGLGMEQVKLVTVEEDI
jgi:biopolymer transport protein ExbD